MNDTPLPLTVWAMMTVSFRRLRPAPGAGLGADGVVIVAVDFQDVPAEGPEFVGNGHDVHDVFIGPVDLQSVMVDEQGQVVQFILGLPT